MKSLLTTLFSLLILLSCKQGDNCANGLYTQDYTKFECPVKNLLDHVSAPVNDSIVILIAKYETSIAPLSCLECVAEERFFGQVMNYCKRYPDAQIVLLHHMLMGERLNFGFLAMFKDCYKEQYALLLQKYSIVLIPDNGQLTTEELQKNKLEEAKLPFTDLVEAFINLKQ